MVNRKQINTENEKEKELSKGKRFLNWVSDHKVPIAITSIIIAAPAVILGAVAFIGYKGSQNGIGELGSSDDDEFDNSVTCDSDDDKVFDFSSYSKKSSTRAPHDVDGFVRNLPQGWKASEGKVAEAAEKGINLGKNQTYVNSYRTGVGN